jgi:hypothetical protein
MSADAKAKIGFGLEGSSRRGSRLGASGATIGSDEETTGEGLAGASNNMGRLGLWNKACDPRPRNGGLST